MRGGDRCNSEPSPGRRRARAGVTLVEVVVSTILVATVLLISITASANLLRNQSRQFAAVDSVEVLSRLLDEVTAMEFREPDGESTFGPEPDEPPGDRQHFDDVDDYHGLQMSPPTHRNGSPIEGFETWSAEFTVVRARSSGDGVAPVDDVDGDAPLRIITAALVDPTGRRWEQSAWVADVPVAVPEDEAYERLRHIELRFPGRPDVNLTVPLRNRPAPNEAE